MLGSDLVAELIRRGASLSSGQASKPAQSAPDDLSHFCIHPLDLPEFNITNSAQVNEALSGADVIINCAAYTNVDGAESEPDLARRVNADAVAGLAELAARTGAWVLHISTDFVFDGQLNRPYREQDEARPLSVYGQTKLEGERALLSSDERHCVVRVSWTFGASGQSFVTKVIQRAREAGRLQVVDDQVGSPTSTLKLAQALCALIPVRPGGLFHLAAQGYTSRFAMAQLILSRLGLDAELSPCKTSDYPTPAARPLNSRFDCSKIQRELGLSMDAWEIPLTQHLERS